jgi:hypothetical protein
VCTPRSNAAHPRELGLGSDRPRHEDARRQRRTETWQRHKISERRAVELDRSPQEQTPRRTDARAPDRGRGGRAGDPVSRPLHQDSRPRKPGRRRTQRRGAAQTPGRVPGMKRDERGQHPNLRTPKRTLNHAHISDPGRVELRKIRGDLQGSREGEKKILICDYLVTY